MSDTLSTSKLWVTGEQVPPSDQITFHPNHGEEVLVLRTDGFYYRGQLIEDAGEAHRLFTEFFNRARKEARSDWRNESHASEWGLEWVDAVNARSKLERENAALREALEYAAKAYDDGELHHVLASKLYDVSCVARRALDPKKAQP